MNAHANSSATRRLLEEARSGDPRAFDSLFQEHRAFLRQLVALRMDRRLRARLDPSDIVQETHLEAVRRLAEAGEQPALPFRLWLRQIACDRLAMAWQRHLRAARRSAERDVRLPEHSSAALAQQLLAGHPSPSEQLSRHEAARLLRRALERLPDADREIVLLHSFEGLTSQESARLLGLTPAAARKRYGRALLRLRKLLVEHGLGESRS